MTLLSFLSAGTAHDLGWTLLHFLWQGLLLAAALELALNLVRSATARHNCALAALVLMILAPVVTFLVLHGQGSAPDASGAVLASPVDAGPSLNLIVTPAAPSPWVNWLVLLWLAGVAGLSLRALGGWVLVESLRRRDTAALPAALMQRCRALQRQLQVTRPVRFLQSLRVATPVVVGWLRPVILLPLSALAGLPPQQLDALILHELAHIRRHDAFINALLLAAETVLFYHPAVWWVSRRIRIERENCCDDLAVAHCGDAALYVEALASLEEGRLPPGLALAAGGRLQARAARLLGVPAQTRRHSMGAITGLAAVTLIAVSVAVAQPGPPTPAQTSAIEAPAFQVPQNAIVGNVRFIGNSKITVRDLSRETRIKTGDTLTRAAVEADVTRLKELYRRNGKYYARIAPGFIRAANRTDLVFTITEGPTVGIGRIDFVGNKAFAADTLKAQILTQESAWYRPLSTNDNYDPDRVAYDRELLGRFYADRGYADVKITNAVAQLEPGGGAFDITFTLDEGKQYHFGEVSISSKIAALPQAQLLPLISAMYSGDVYNRSLVQKSLDALTNAARVKGYAFAQVSPRIQRDPNGKPIINVVINIDQGPRVAIRHIVVSGTQRATVLGYIAPLREGDPFDIAQINAAQERLHASGLFSDLAVTFDPTDTLTIRVVEKSAPAASSSVPLPGRTGANMPKFKTTGLEITDDKGVQPPINIRADKISNNGRGLPTLFEGNVVMQQGGITIRADTVRAEVAPSSPAAPGGTLTRLIADGYVVLTQNGVTSRSTHLQTDVIDHALRPEMPPEPR